MKPALQSYFQKHAYREPDLLAELRAYTAEQFGMAARMQISPEQGQFMQWIAKAIAAQRILEIGTFTGYSALWFALGLPENGVVVTCDVDPKATEVAREFWEKAGVANQIKLKLKPALDTLNELQKITPYGFFDLVFIDADKRNYDTYYEKSLSLLRPGGVILIDNVFQNEGVADPNNHQPNIVALRQLNDKLLSDERVTMSMIPLRDGVTLVYKNS